MGVSIRSRPRGGTSAPASTRRSIAIQPGGRGMRMEMHVTLLPWVAISKYAFIRRPQRPPKASPAASGSNDSAAAAAAAAATDAESFAGATRLETTHEQLERSPAAHPCMKSIHHTARSTRPCPSAASVPSVAPVCSLMHFMLGGPWMVCLCLDLVTPLQLNFTPQSPDQGGGSQAAETTTTTTQRASSS